MSVEDHSKLSYTYNKTEVASVQLEQLMPLDTDHHHMQFSASGRPVILVSEEITLIRIFAGDYPQRRH